MGFGMAPDVYQPWWLETVQLAIYARLKPDMSLKQARAGLEIVVRRMDAGLPAERSKYARNISVSPVTGFERFAGGGGLLSLSIFFALLLMVVGLVLLIACANVAILLLARGSARRGETAVRLALGVSRPRLLQQFLAESVLLATLGTAFGLLLSRLTGILIAAIEPLLAGPIHLQLTPDWRLLLYSALLMAIATIVCGLFPAWQSWRVSITPNLARGQKSRLQSVLVVLQIATSVIILAAGFLFLHNLLRTNSISPGFDVRHTLHAEINLPPNQYRNPQRRVAYVQQALRQIGALPGIECAAAAKWTPFNGYEGYGVTLKFPDSGQQNSVFYVWNAVTPAYFRTMNVPIYSGSTFSETEQGVKHVVVNQAFVERYLAGRLRVGTVFEGVYDTMTTSRIIAVVGNTKTRTLGEEEQPQLYESFNETKDDNLSIKIEARSAISAALQIEPIKHALYRVEPLAGVKVQTVNASIGFAFLPSKLGAGALGALGVLGLLLTTVGIYAVVAYSVMQRRREIGIRIAVGATRADISWMVFRDAAQMTFIGLSVGLFAAFFITRPLAMFLVPGLKPTDPLTFGAVVAAMILTGMIAAFGPARHANRIDPNVALRYEQS